MSSMSMFVVMCACESCHSISLDNIQDMDMDTDKDKKKDKDKETPSPPPTK
jgi:hypothetical protein